jgi:hypothetical protein
MTYASIIIGKEKIERNDRCGTVGGVNEKTRRLTIEYREGL